jgi:hypothetical protein
LECSFVDLVVGRRGLEMVQDSDVATHGRNDT